jgi:hypothetical protein
MRVVGLFLVAAWLLSASAVGAEPAKKKDAKDAKAAADNVDRVQEALDRLGKMDAAGQRAWLKRLETRLVRAAKLTLPPDEAARHIAKTRAQLHQQTVTWESLGQVADDIDWREKAAIDRLVKHYRTLVFDGFHKQIDEYGQRQQAWLDIRTDWERAGSQFDQQDRLIDWLEAAATSVAPGKTGPIPEKPKFEAAAAENAKPKEEPKRSGGGAGPIEPGPPPVLARLGRKASANPAQLVAEPPLPKPEPATVSLGPNRSAIRLLIWRHEVERRTATDASAPAPATFARPWEPHPKTVGGTGMPRQSLEVKTIAVSQPTAGERVTRKVPYVALAKEIQVPSGPATSTPASAPARRSLPRAELAAAADDAARPEKVEIQPDELAARIGGCNLAFRALETELNEKSDWTAARLEPLADRLKLLVTRRNDLHLFREAISEQQRSSIDPLASPKAVVSPLAERIVEARGRATGSAFHGTEAERQAELQRLDELSRRLAELAGK